jgi:hypothetical protein
MLQALSPAAVSLAGGATLTLTLAAPLPFLNDTPANGTAGLVPGLSVSLGVGVLPGSGLPCPVLSYSPGSGGGSATVTCQAPSLLGNVVAEFWRLGQYRSGPTASGVSLPIIDLNSVSPSRFSRKEGSVAQPPCVCSSTAPSLALRGCHA